MSKVQVYWETIKGGIWNLPFILFAVGLLTAYSTGNTTEMIAAIVGYVGLKTALNLRSTVAESDKQLSVLEHFCLSTRTWFAAFGMWYCWTHNMPNEFDLILKGFGVSWGLDTLVVALKVNWGGLMAKTNKPPQQIIVSPAPSTYAPPQIPPPVPQLPPVVVQPVPEPVIPLLKDKIALIREYYGKGNNYREYFRGAIANTINNWVQHMVQVNPQYTTVEIAREIADKFFKRTLTAQECSTIQGILGLEAIIKSMRDQNIVEGFFVAFDNFKELAYLEKIFRDAAVAQSTCDAIMEAAGRASRGDIDINKARLALREFGLSTSDIARTEWAGNLIRKIWLANHYEDFNPYALAGYTPEGDPLQ